MPLKLQRNDITKMHTDAIVNTANALPQVGPGCDYAIYMAAGFDRLLQYRKEKIGKLQEGDVFYTPAFDLGCKYIIHAVSPLYVDGHHEEELKLRSCYRKSLALAAELKLNSIAFPLIATGSFSFPKEEGLQIAVDEIKSFLMTHEMLVYLVVFGADSLAVGKKHVNQLDLYIDQHYVDQKEQFEYPTYEAAAPRNSKARRPLPERPFSSMIDNFSQRKGSRRSIFKKNEAPSKPLSESIFVKDEAFVSQDSSYDSSYDSAVDGEINFEETHGFALEERMAHMSDTFSQYLIYLIDSRGMTYPEVYKRAIVDKKAFSKIKNNPDAHPKKITAMCLCIGARLNMDQTRDLLARAGYALSPCDKTDIIFSYFIENKIYDMIELDIQLEEHGLPCLIA